MVMVILAILLSLLFIYFSARYNWWRKSVSYKIPRIFMYHSIDYHKGEKHDKWRVKPDVFEKQMKFLYSNGWKSFTVSQLLSMKTIPEKSFAITFDDGYEDNFINAFEILKKYDFKATIYLVAERNTNDWDSQQTSFLSNLLNKEQIKSMVDSGIIEFGSHTLSHCNLLKSQELDKEIGLSKEKIQNTTQKDCVAFAYPYGRFDSNIIQCVKKHGYTSAVTVKAGFGIDNKFTIPRISIMGKDNFLDFLLKINKGKSKL